MSPPGVGGRAGGSGGRAVARHAGVQQAGPGPPCTAAGRSLMSCAQGPGGLQAPAPPAGEAGGAGLDRPGRAGRLTHGNGRVHSLHIALLHQHLQRLLTQHLHIVLLERLAGPQLFYPPAGRSAGGRAGGAWRRIAGAIAARAPVQLALPSHAARRRPRRLALPLQGHDQDRSAAQAGAFAGFGWPGVLTQAARAGGTRTLCQPCTGACGGRGARQRHGPGRCTWGKLRRLSQQTAGARAHDLFCSLPATPSPPEQQPCWPPLAGRRALAARGRRPSAAGCLHASGSP